MSFQSCPDVAEVVIHASIGGVNMANVLHFHKASGYTQTDIDNLAALVDAEVGLHYLPVISGGVQYSRTVVRGLTSMIDLTGEANAHAGPGLVSSATMPNNVTLCITLRTGFTGRSARGRFFIFPMGESQLVAANTIDPSVGTSLHLFFLNLINNGAISGWNLCVLSRFSGGVRRTTGVATKVTSGSERNSIVDSQRHRLPRGH